MAERLSDNKIGTLKRKRQPDDKLEDWKVPAVPRVRTLKFDLSNCPEWVRTQSDEELFQIFKIGVAVKESITMKITKGEQYFDKVVRQVKDTEMALEGKINKLLEPLHDCKDQLMQLACKPASKGAVGELVVRSVLEEGLPHHSVEDVSTTKGKYGDIHVTSTVSGQTHLLEIKTHKRTVSASDIEKFEDDLRQTKHCSVGILLSLDSGIAMRAKYGKFEIAYADKQYFIYVPNARREENLIVWSVLLADELAALEQGLTESQTQELLKLQQRFQQNMEKTKACRAKFSSLKEIVNELEANLMPLLHVIDGAKSELNKALHQRAPTTVKRQKKVVSTSQQNLNIEDFFSSAKIISNTKRFQQTRSQLRPQSDPKSKPKDTGDCTMYSSGSLGHFFALEHSHESLHKF